MSPRRRQVLFRDRRVSIGLGAALIVAGAYLLHEAYEARGSSRPFALRFLPGG